MERSSCLGGRRPCPHPRRRRAAPPAQLGPAREVLRRRRERLRRQPRRLHRAAARRRTSTTCPRRSCSFLVAVTNNYVWNRLWTFRGERGHVAYQGMRFFVVSLRRAGSRTSSSSHAGPARPGQDRRAGDRDRPRHPVELRRQQALVVPATLTRLGASGRASPRLALAPPARGTRRRLRPPRSTTARAASSQTPFAPRREPAAADRASARSPSSSRDPKVARLARPLPDEGPRHRGRASRRRVGDWTVKVWSGDGRRDRDRHASTTAAASSKEAWTGPQVAWTMARGGQGAFGGKKINSPSSGSPSARVFLLGLADCGRPLSLRNLDLLALLSFAVSLWFFNHGDIFTSVPLAYPPLALPARPHGLDRRSRPRAAGGSRPLWPVWVLVAATVFLAGFRVGLNIEASNVIDVGYAGVIGAQRIANGEAPYGHFPVRGRRSRRAARPTPRARSASGSRRTGAARRRTSAATRTGRSRTTRTSPATRSFGWTGKWDDLPGGALHVDRVRSALPARARARRAALRRQPARGDARVRLGRVPVHAVRLELEHERRDPARVADLGLLAASSPWARGGFAALAAGRSSRALVVAPLWATYPDGWTWPRTRRLRSAASRLATLAAFWVLLLEPTRCTRRASSGTGRSAASSAASRRSRSGTGASTTRRPARPPPRPAGARGCCSSPARSRSPSCRAGSRRSSSPRSPAALLLGFELVLTHWFYLYVPWFFPFVAVALILARPQPEPSRRALSRRELTAAASRSPLLRRRGRAAPGRA